MGSGFANTLVRCFVGFVALASSPLLADKILLKDGSVIEGEVFHQTSVFVRVRNSAGVQTVNKVDIRRIIFEEVKKPADEDRQRAEALERVRLAEEARRAQEAQAIEAQKREEARKAEEARRQKEEEEKARNAEKPREITHRGAIWRSAVLPGWGQYYTGRKKVGLGLGAAFGFTAGLKLFTLAGATHARKDYLAVVDQLLIASVLVGGPGRTLSGLEFIRLNERKQAIERLDRRSNFDRYATGLLLVAYGANMIDVVLYKPGKYSLVSFGTDGSQARLAYRFEF
ncbi:MAG: hypothetical protein JNM27_16920 [Leptospirales bacterium]|nr:hypothetical protein [Leptospirales bacterium]